MRHSAAAAAVALARRQTTGGRPVSGGSHGDLTWFCGTAWLFAAAARPPSSAIYRAICRKRAPRGRFAAGSRWNGYSGNQGICLTTAADAGTCSGSEPSRPCMEAYWRAAAARLVWWHLAMAHGPRGRRLRVEGNHRDGLMWPRQARWSRAVVVARRFWQASAVHCGGESFAALLQEPFCVLNALLFTYPTPLIRWWARASSAG